MSTTNQSDNVYVPSGTSAGDWVQQQQNYRQFTSRHDHVQHTCKHEHLAYCDTCKLVYCRDCGKEWREYGQAWNLLQQYGQATRLAGYPEQPKFIGSAEVQRPGNAITPMAGCEHAHNT